MKRPGWQTREGGREGGRERRVKEVGVEMMMHHSFRRAWRRILRAMTTIIVHHKTEEGEGGETDALFCTVGVKSVNLPP